MVIFTREQKLKALFWLSFWHILIIASSNFLVQIPFKIGPLHTTWGAFTFPFIFLTTDLTVRIFGQWLARKIIFCVMIPALFFSYTVSVVFDHGHFMGLGALSSINWFVMRIAIASFVAYVCGQLMDIFVFNPLRQNPRWWLAPVASSILGSAVDTVVFFSIAFYHSPDAFMAAHWWQFAIVDYGWKLAISGAFFLPAYGYILKYLLKKLTTLEKQQKARPLPSEAL